MTQYNGLAAIYDQLMQGIDYDEWATHILELTALHQGVPEKSALDLACGTGSTTIALARLGLRVIGLDLSSEMLALAQDKSENVQLTYTQQDMRSFTLPAAVGLVVSFQDGINYLLTQEDLARTMTSVYQSLLPDGLFIFDINRVEKLKNTTSDLAWADCDDFALVWETRFVEEEIWEINITGFAKTAEGHYRKFNEVHKERIISHQEVVSTLHKTSFTLLGTYEAFTINEPDENTRRVFYVAKKEG
jgi:SAM-dependent methyltransferase